MVYEYVSRLRGVFGDASARRLAGRGRRTAVLRSAYNDSHLDNPHVNAQLNAAIASPVSPARSPTRGIDHALVRDVAPAIAFANESEHDFFSARIGCSSTSR